MVKQEDALDYHSKGRPGKIEVIPTKPTASQRDLSMAYSPGVAEPCLAIAANPELVRKYTAKGNLVGVISNGTAVLGLGNIGPEASKPVMEGKGILFKIFADIDVFDIELNVTDTEAFIQTVKALEPTFGGINLEDIKAPECFEIERRLKAEMNIPVMHDDQHGTAIIVGAAMLNAAELTGKKLKDLKMVVSGAGASALSCIKILIGLGINKDNVIVNDSSGILRTDREDLDAIKKEFATSKDVKTLDEAMQDADVFLGLSKGNILKPEHLMKMAPNPIVFALANPTPEIDYHLALETRDDIIIATGRSDHPNQVNNVLGFPYIFRGALDVHSKAINEEMKLAAVYALADLAKKPVPDMVSNTYNLSDIKFGKDYIIPKPIDPRLITTVAPAVAKAAMDSGVAGIQITDWDLYEEQLRSRIGLDNKLTRVIIRRAKENPKRVVFAEADSIKILKAAQIVCEEGIASPILLGNKESIIGLIKEANLDLLNDVPIIDPVNEKDSNILKYAEILFAKRQRHGISMHEAIRFMKTRNYYGAAMVENGDADALISGLTRKYTSTIKPALDVIGVAEGFKKISGMYIMITKKGTYFFADTTMIIKPSLEDLIEITELTARAVESLSIKPKIAFLSYSNFGSTDSEEAKTCAKAVRILKEKHPDMIVDGEIQANFALNSELLDEYYPFSDLVNHKVNTLIFPSLDSGNIAYKLLQEFGTAEAIGPVVLGMRKSVHVLQQGSSVREIVNMVALSVMDAQIKEGIK